MRSSSWAGRLLLALLLVFVVYVSINGLRSEGPGARGLPAGARMAPFAAPLATSGLEGDVNVATAETLGDVAGRRPACEVRGPDVVNACALWAGAPVALAFLATRGGDCTASLDQLERVRRSAPGVRIAAVALRGDRDDLRRLVRARGWRFPVAYDRDGVLANLYAVAVCPQIVLGRPGGVVAETLIGRVSDAYLSRRLALLAR